MIRYFFSMQPDQADVKTILSVQLPPGVELKTTRTGVTWISSSTKKVNISDLNLSNVGTQFENFAKSVSEIIPSNAFGINFWLDFESQIDAHGLHFSSEFLSEVAAWRPSVDVSINIQEDRENLFGNGTDD